MKLVIPKGTTSKRIGVFIQDSSSTTGAGLTGLAFNTASLTWYYWREDEGNADATAVTLATATRGTFASGGFIEKDATNMPGFYELGVPNAALATGAEWVTMILKGATNMAPLTIEIQLSDPVRGLGSPTALPNAAAEAAGGLYTRGTGAGQINQAANGSIDANAVALSGDTVAADNAEAFFDGTGYAGTNNVIPTVTTVTNLTNAPTNGDLTATMKTSVTTAATAATPTAAAVTGAVGSVTGNVGGNVTGSVGSVAAGGITAASIATGAIDADSLAADALTSIADAVLKRDMSAVVGAASRSLLNAIRFLRNKWSISGTTLTVTAEDDVTSAWTATLTTNASAEPITSSDPA